MDPSRKAKKMATIVPEALKTKPKKKTYFTSPQPIPLPLVINIRKRKKPEIIRADAKAMPKGCQINIR